MHGERADETGKCATALCHSNLSGLCKDKGKLSCARALPSTHKEIVLTGSVALQALRPMKATRRRGRTCEGCSVHLYKIIKKGSSTITSSSRQANGTRPEYSGTGDALGLECKLVANCWTTLTGKGKSGSMSKCRRGFLCGLIGQDPADIRSPVITPNYGSHAP